MDITNRGGTITPFLLRFGTAFAVALMLATMLQGSPSHAASAKIQVFMPNTASATGGEVVAVTGTALEKVTKIRVAGVVQAKLMNRTKSEFSFVFPRLNKNLQKYGGYVNVEYFDSGTWKKARPKFLVTAPRSEAFTSANLTYNLVETNQPSSIARRSGLSALTPSQGARLFGVKLNVLNMSDSWIDLSCSYEVDVRIIDTTFRRFNYVQGGHRFEGNPECNYFMNPGFSADMLWVFDVANVFNPIVLEVTTVVFGAGPAARTFYLSF